MERSNYTRGGNDGGNRGGRNNGGRSAWGVQDGGRGGNGRGGYPHGGRNGNHSQQYSNQHQEQNQGGGRGRGRGRDSGGSGRERGQHTHRTPPYPMQNENRVPDRIDGGREVTTWSRVASGQPVGTPSLPHIQSLTQNRIDLQVQGVEARVSSLSINSKDDVANAYVPIRRPDRGTIAMRYVKLAVNHFPVKFDLSISILRYDIDIKHEAEQNAPSSSRALKKWLCFYFFLFFLFFTIKWWVTGWVTGQQVTESSLRQIQEMGRSACTHTKRPF